MVVTHSCYYTLGGIQVKLLKGDPLVIISIASILLEMHTIEVRTNNSRKIEVL